MVAITVVDLCIAAGENGRSCVCFSSLCFSSAFDCRSRCFCCFCCSAKFNLHPFEAVVVVSALRLSFAFAAGSFSFLLKTVAADVVVIPDLVLVLVPVLATIEEVDIIAAVVSVSRGKAAGEKMKMGTSFRGLSFGAGVGLRNALLMLSIRRENGFFHLHFFIALRFSICTKILCN